MEALTKKQDKLHAYLCSRWADSPTIREMGEFMGVSVNAIMGHLKALEAKGYIERRTGKSRGIRLLVARDMTGTEVEFGGGTYVLVGKKFWETIKEDSEYARAVSQTG